MTAFAIDDSDLAYLGEAGVVAEDALAYLSSMARAGRLLSARGWDDDELYSAQLFDLPTSPEKVALLQLRENLQLSTDPDAYLMCTPLGDRIRRPEPS